jgi:hypothetical protein
MSPKKPNDSEDEELVVFATYCESCMDGIEAGEDVYSVELGKTIIHKPGGHAIFDCTEGNMYIHDFCFELLLKNRKIEIQKEPLRCSICLESIAPNSSIPYCLRLISGDVEGNAEELDIRFTEDTTKYDYYLCPICANDGFVESDIIDTWVMKIDEEISNKK